MADRIQIRTGSTSDATTADETLACNVDGAELGITDDRVSGVGDVRGWLGDPDGNSFTDQVAIDSRGIWATPSDLDAIPAGGDVSGPSSSVDSEIALFSSTTGKVIKRMSGSGIVKVASGVASTATAGTDYYAPGGTDVAITDGGTGASTLPSGILKGAGTGAITAATSGTDYAPATSGSAILKGNGSGGFSSASAGTDYVGATSGSAVQKANGSGGLTGASAGTDFYAPGSTDVAVADGGTGASSALVARANLGLQIGVDVLAPNGSGAALTSIPESAVTNLVTDLAAKQPLDSDLTTIAGLTATTDNVLMAVSSAWASRTPAQVRATLGLVVGTNVQAWDADLDTWATKTPPSGTPVGTTDTQTLSAKRVTPRVATISSSATPTLNTDGADVGNCLALATNVTSMTTNLSGTPTDGDRLLLRFKDTGTAKTIIWGASFQSSGVAPLLATTVGGKTHHVGLIYDGAASKWTCLAVDAAGY